MFLDLSLRDEDGMDLGKKALDIYPHLPIVVLTQLKMFDTVQACMNAGFSGYLLKPASKSDLQPLLDRLLTKGYILKDERFIDRAASFERPFEADLANPMETAIKYIQLYYYKQLTLKEISNLVYLSPSHFSRMFKEEMGVNFVEYLIKFRVEKAKKLLKMTMLPMEVVSTNCGFSSAAHFSTTFKKIEGVTPSVYRNLFSNLNQKKR